MLCSQLDTANNSKASVCACAGLLISNIKLDVGLFGNPRERPVLLDALTISTLHVTYPSFTKPLSVSIRGACVKMRQNRNPKVTLEVARADAFMVLREAARCHGSSLSTAGPRVHSRLS